MNLRRLKYYLSNYFHYYFIPRSMHRRYRNYCYDLLKQGDISSTACKRLHYYNSMSKICDLGVCDVDFTTRDLPQTVRCSDVNKINIGSMYSFDLLRYLVSYPSDLMVSLEMGDVTHVPDVPRIVKSRPIAKKEESENSILMKLDSFRHFRFVNDRILFKDKLNKLMWRGSAYQPHRIDFLERFFTSSYCDVAQVNNSDQYAFGSYLSIKKQLQFKYILCIEGNDVATNLKWVMSSNSLCFMVRPTYETWFMEGLLQPGVHYVELKKDYSDLAEKIDFYNANPKAADKIIANANRFCNQFKNKQVEDLVSFLVLDKFFYYTSQVDSLVCLA